MGHFVIEHFKKFINTGACPGNEDGTCTEPHITSQRLEELRTVYGANSQLIKQQLKS